MHRRLELARPCGEAPLPSSISVTRLSKVELFQDGLNVDLQPLLLPLQQPCVQVPLHSGGGILRAAKALIVKKVEVKIDDKKDHKSSGISETDQFESRV